MDYGSTVTQQSLISWLISSLGFPYLVVLPLAALISFLLALVIVMRGRGAMGAACLILVVHVPFLVGVFAALQGMISSYSIIALSPASPKPSEIAAGISIALVAPLTSLILMTPAYAVATIGSMIRCLTDQSSAQSAP